ncbi:MAG: polysaccharide deacetylase family protein [Ruminiclostridium sp.]|nr:polysaccharide deacetylase family protein [Ruminiclostridium sp.]
MKIRRILCAVLTAAMIGSVSSCGCESGSPVEPTNTTTTAETTTRETTTERTTTTTTEMPPDTDTEIVGTTDIITDDGLVSESVDEAAYASSYIDMTKIGWGLGKDKNDKNQPIDAVKAQEKYKDCNGEFLCDDGKILLTFDVGYENGCTAEILDTLKEKNIKAVFFVTYDYCKTSPELVKRMIDEGHTVGNHTYTHPSMPDCSESEMIEEVMTLHDYVAEKFGCKMELFRFPKGEFSEKALSVVKSLGYTSVFWSFAYSDWDVNAQPDPMQSLQKIKDSTHSGIYLLHAVSETNTQILGEVIDYWQSEGYEIICKL